MDLKTLMKVAKRKLIQFAKPYLSRRILRRAQKNLAAISAQCFEHSALRKANIISLGELLNDEEITAEWKKSDNQPSLFRQPDGTGGVNLGDRRAIFHLVRGLWVKSVLEIGTYIGASSFQIARVLSLNGGESLMCSIDISEVNSNLVKHWLAYNASHSPREVVNLAGVGEKVEFFILRR